MSDLLTRRTAVIDGPCRFTLGRQWDDRLPMAAWLLCNPSTADADLDDQTCRRMTHFSRAAGCGGFNAVNTWPLRTAYPADLWKMLRRGALTHAMDVGNFAAVEMVAATAEVHLVAFGPEPPRRDLGRVVLLLAAFSAHGTRPLLCLGTSPEGWPLHPLARGKFAIPNSRRPEPWECPQ